MAAGLFAVNLAEAQRPDQRKKIQRPGSRTFPRRPGGFGRENSLKVGDKAPNFTLKTLDGKKEVTLSSFKGKQPVLLVFGSYT